MADAAPGPAPTPPPAAAPTPAPEPRRTRDVWEKLDIVLKGLLPLAVAGVGYFGTSYLSEQQRAESTTQFYTGLLAQREEADSNLRKEMFSYAIQNFLGDPQKDPRKMVIGLEMLALNFHDSFDLSPLFKSTFAYLQQSPADDAGGQPLTQRLIDIASEITNRQAASLADAEHRWDAEISDFSVTRAPDFGSARLFERELVPLAQALRRDRGAPPVTRAFLELLAVDTRNKTVQLRLEVRRPKDPQPVVERVIVLSYFDFPAMNNIRLPGRERLAVSLTRFDGNSAQLQVLHFPETRASLKEKPYFDDLISDMRPRGAP